MYLKLNNISRGLVK